MSFRENAKIIKTGCLGTGVYEIWFETSDIAKAAKPGQFISVYSTDGSRLLPRPISICAIVDNKLRIVYRTVGAGTKEFSYGMVVLINGKEEKFSQKMTDPELAQMRNVAGEIMGARAAMEYAIANNKKRLVIYHDYEGIAKWPLGIWKTNKEGTIAYKAYYDETKTKVSVRFQKVTGHSGDKYNDYADKLAKQALGLA